jgi:hypothetical protein
VRANDHAFTVDVADPQVYSCTLNNPVLAENDHPFKNCGQPPRSVVESWWSDRNPDNPEPSWCRLLADLPIRSSINSGRVDCLSLIMRERCPNQRVRLSVSPTLCVAFLREISKSRGVLRLQLECGKLPHRPTIGKVILGWSQL